MTGLHQLNDDIWMPIVNAYPARDVAGYLAVHAPDFTWIQAEQHIIEGLDEYGARIRKSFAELPAGITVHLEFRFSERIAGGRMASERGVARMSGDGPKGPLPVRYNHFHTLARCENGHWRLVVDYDGALADAAAFNAAHPADDLAHFPQP